MVQSVNSRVDAETLNLLWPHYEGSYPEGLVCMIVNSKVRRWLSNPCIYSLTDTTNSLVIVSREPRCTAREPRSYILFLAATLRLDRRPNAVRTFSYLVYPSGRLRIFAARIGEGYSPARPEGELCYHVISYLRRDISLTFKRKYVFDL